MTGNAQTYRWNELNRLQVGLYAAYYVKMQFVLLGCEVYSSEVDDRGIDFVLRRERFQGANDSPAHYWNIQVTSPRKTGYVFFPKDKFLMRSNGLVALVIFEDGREPNLFLIPATAWLKPDNVLVDRDYEGRKSAPEYGVNLSKKGILALEQ
jgi:hypothetical protein